MMTKGYFAYIMTNKSKTLYTVVTNNLVERVMNIKVFLDLQSDTILRNLFILKLGMISMLRLQERNK